MAFTKKVIMLEDKSLEEYIAFLEFFGIDSEIKATGNCDYSGINEVEVVAKIKSKEDVLLVEGYLTGEINGRV